jgi:hypothetical protein
MVAATSQPIRGFATNCMVISIYRRYHHVHTARLAGTLARWALTAVVVRHRSGKWMVIWEGGELGNRFWISGY